MPPRLGWLPWAPHLLALALLLALAVNTNLGRPWRGITPSDADAGAVAAVLLVGSLPWYTAFLLALRHPALGPVGAVPALRALAAAVTTAAVVALLGLTERSGGIVAFNLQDLLVTAPGVTAVALADGLDVRGLLPDGDRVDPRRWGARRRAGERRRVTWAAALPDGRLLVQVRVTWERGVFGDGAAEALVALRPDGALDEEFAANVPRPVEGTPLVAGDRVVLAGGATPAVLALRDGAPAAAEGRRLAAALAAAGATESAPGGAPGTLAARGPGGRGEVTLLDLSGATPRVLGRAAPGAGRAPAWASAVADGDGLLLPAETSVLLPRPSSAGGPPADAAPLVEQLLRRHGADGARDPGFRFELPPAILRRLGPVNLAVRALVSIGGRPVVLLHGDGDALAVVGRGGAVDAGGWLDLDGRRGEGFVADVVPLEDGRVALVSSPRDGRTPVAIVTPGRGGALPPAGAGAGGDGRIVAGEVLAVTGRGEVVARGPGGLRVVDLATGEERALRAPAWLETP